VVLKFGVLAP